MFVNYMYILTFNIIRYDSFNDKATKSREMKFLAQVASMC